MSRLRGRSIGSGMALGIAVAVQSNNGLPIFPSMPASVAQRLASRKQTEKADIVLIARDLATALSFVDSIRWASVVGIAAESDEYDGPYPDMPVVLSVAQLFEMVTIDTLVLIDADRGLVDIDPDGVRLAQYQAEHDHIAPKRRLFLDDVHLPAQTLDGRTIQMVASVSTESDIAEAITQGADVLYVPFNCALLPDESDEEILRQKLFRLIELAVSKPLILSDDYALPPSLVLEAAAMVDLMISIPPKYDLEGYGFTELENELSEKESELEELDILGNQPRLAAEAAYDPDHLSDENAKEWAAQLAIRKAERIIYHTGESPPPIRFLENLCAAAAAYTIPIFLESLPVRNEYSDKDTLEFQLMLGAGIGGFIIPPDSILEYKQRVRDLSYSECRQKMWDFLKSEGHPNE